MKFLANLFKPYPPFRIKEKIMGDGTVHYIVEAHYTNDYGSGYMALHDKSKPWQDLVFTLEEAQAEIKKRTKELIANKVVSERVIKF